MSYPILYSATETSFDHNGIGILSSCVSCEVTEEANGIFELAMQYPMDGIHFEDIADRAIIKAKADQFRDPQLFRVYATSKPMNGIVTVLAEHISYDLSGIPIKPFSAENVSTALLGLQNNAVVDCPFIFWTDKGTSAKFNVQTPASIRSRLGGVSGSILDVYGGEYEFDNYTVKLHNNRGMNRGVSIRYGKNLTDIKQDQNCSNVATGIYPYWYLETDVGNVLIELPEKIVPAPGTYNFVKIRTLDLSAEFEVQPTHEQLREKTQEYINANKIGVPAVSWSVSFEQLSKSEEYKHLALLERVSLFDTVNVEFPALKVSATAKAVKMVYDVLADRVKSVTLGSVRANIADTIATQQQEIEKKPSKTFMEQAIESLTKTILGAKGGSVRFLDENGDGEPDTLYIADNPNPMQAVKVWRFNYEGWGASENGYNGPFKLGATIKNGIVADFITAGTLNSALINGKTLVIEDGAVISTWKVNENSIYENEGNWPQGTFMCTGSKGAYSIGGSPDIPNWVFGAGGKFGVTKEGAVWLSDVHVNNGEMAVTSETNGTVRIHNGTLSVANTSGDVKIKTAPLVHMNGNTGAIDDKGTAMTFISDAGEWVAALQMWQNDFQILLPADNVPGGQKFLMMAPKWKYRDDIGYYIGV